MDRADRILSARSTETARSRSADPLPANGCGEPDYVNLHLIGHSKAFLTTLGLVRKMAACDATVLIQGDTGTGKELAARAIHYLGTRARGPFIALNCGALPDTLIETELFGHARGAFTDAKENRLGVIAQARGGTLFLDELEALCPRGQVALLRFLQDKTYRPVGGPVRDADVRVIGASNTNLQALVRAGIYRADLLFRMSVLLLDMPPLRERPGDALLLAESFLERFGRQYGHPPKTLDARAVRYLHEYHWPGNVRELENLIHRECLLTEGAVISFPADRSEPATRSPESSSAVSESFNQARARAIDAFEKAYLADLLRASDGNISLASRISGKERSRLGKLVRKHGLDPRTYARTLRSA